MRDRIQHQQDLQATLEQVLDLLQKQQLVSGLVEKQASARHDLVQTLVDRQHLAELQRKLEHLHPADVAFVIENLPHDQRQLVWSLVKPERYGAILLELSDPVRAGLIGRMDYEEIVDVAGQLESEELAEIVPNLPKDMAFEVLNALDRETRSRVQSMLEFPDGTIGALMDFDMVTVREDVDLDVVLRYLRKRGQLPDRLEQVFVVDRAGMLKGLLSLKELVVRDPDVRVAQVMVRDPVYFYTDDPARDAVQAFERYDLLTAPVVNLHNQLVGNLSVDAVMDYMSEKAQGERLKEVGLSASEDLLGPLWKSGRARWAWLGLNLMTAFVASRVIGLFEGSIAKLVALAALMPIVASVGGNTGNQTVALMIRGLAVNQINPGNFGYVLFKEIGISLMNGAIFGAVVGVFAYLLYFKVSLALVMAGAMILNLLIAALAGVFIPVGLHKLGRDPVMGSSVMLTALTDSMGFFIFLGLATVFLV